LIPFRHNFDEKLINTLSHPSFSIKILRQTLLQVVRNPLYTAFQIFLYIYLLSHTSKDNKMSSESTELDMDYITKAGSNDTDPNSNNDKYSSTERTPLLPIANKYKKIPTSNSRITFSSYLPQSISWIPDSLINFISNVSNIVHSSINSTIKSVPSILTPQNFNYSTIPSISSKFVSQAASSAKFLKDHRRIFKILFILHLILGFMIYRYSHSGPFLPFSCQMINIGCPSVRVSGFTTPEFAGVKKIFEENIKNGLDVGAGVSVFYDNKMVVDLQGGIANMATGSAYDAETLQLVFSSSKVLSGIVIARLVEQGLLNYDEKISKYWPEFAQGGKENVTLLDLVVHRAGVGYIDSHQMTLSDLSNLDSLAKILQSQPHNFNSVPTKAYHGVSRGWYLNEIVRRVDPRHRTIGRIVAEEIAPVYDIEFYYSITKKSLYQRVANIYSYPMVRILAKVLLPKWMISEPLEPIFDEMMKTDSVTYKTLVQTAPDRSQPQDWNRFEMLNYEGPSYSGVTNSKSMAKLAAIMANGGKPIGNSVTGVLEPTILSKDTYDLVMTKLPETFDVVLQTNITSSIGGFGYFRLKGVEEYDFIGWGGSGGSLLLWNPELKVGFGYCMNAFHTSLSGDKRSLRMLREVVDTVKNLKKS
ncbi:1563_t:CDS:2, partial [Cetraspora pellucida]